MGIIGSFCWMFLLLGTYQFFKMYKFSNKLLLMFFVMLNLSMIFRTVYFFYQAPYKYRSWRAVPKWGLSIILYINNLFYSSAILFNLFNWVYHIVTINSYLKNRDDQRRLNIVIILLVAMQIFNVLVFAVFLLGGWGAPETAFGNIKRINDGIMASFFFILATMFLIAGIILYRRISAVSIAKAKVMKKRIIISIILIWIPVFIRCIFDFLDVGLRFHYPFREKSLRENSISYPIFYIFFFTFLDLLPMGFQYITVQMVIRHYSQKVSNYMSISTSKGEKYSKKESLGSERKFTDSFSSSRYVHFYS